MKNKLFIGLFFIISLLSFGNENKKDLKIGLALSGGGAKGSAILGVLRTLEKYNVKVDYISGTSTGSIIGVLYSLGYPLDGIEKIIDNSDWNYIFSNNIERNFLPIEKKMELDSYFFSVVIDENYNLRFPKGAITGQNMYLELKNLFWVAEEIEDFSKLPIPISIVTANLQNGEKVVIKEGDLAKAVLKSSAIPAFIQPVEENGVFYGDGGVASNLPVTEAFEMGADVVIAIDVSTEDFKLKENSNIIDILTKLSLYKGIENFKEEKEKASIMIIPEIKDHHPLDFTKPKELIKKGIEAAEKNRETLKKLRRKDFRRKKIFHKKKHEIHEIEVVNSSNIKLKDIKPYFPFNKSGFYTREEILLFIKSIYSKANVKKIFYEIKDKKILLDIREINGWKLSGAINYSTDYSLALGLLGKLPNTNNVFIDNTFVRGELSIYPKFYIDKYFIGNGHGFKPFSRIRLKTEKTPLILYDDDSKESKFKVKNHGGEIFLGGSYKSDYLLGFEAIYNNGTLRYDEGNSAFKIFEENLNYLKYGLSFKIDTLNNLYFPSKGFHGEASYETSKNNADFETYFLNASYYYPLNSKLSFGVNASSGKQEGKDIPADEHFKIGGIRNEFNSNIFKFYGMHGMRLHSSEFYKGGLSLTYSLKNNLHFIANYNKLHVDDSPFTINNKKLSKKNSYDGYSLGIGWKTFIGPLEFYVSNDSAGEGVLLQSFFGYSF